MTAPSDPAPSRLLRRCSAPPGLRQTALILLSALTVAACAASPEREPSMAPADPARNDAWTLPEVSADPLHRCIDVPLQSDGHGGLVSHEIGDGGDFTEALPSWNVPSGAPFTVEIRALPAGTGAPWSPWLRIGEWATPLRGVDARVRFDAGKVVIDVLKLERPYRAAQLRFRGTKSALAPDDVTANVVLSDMTGLKRRLAAASQAPWPGTEMVRVAPRSQRAVGPDIGGRVCSPTSVSMVAAYQGANVPTRTMAEKLFDPRYEIYGNWNRAIQGPATLGIPGRLVRISSWATVANYLGRGLPVVASIRASEGQLRGAPYRRTAGHLLVVTGIGPAGAVHVNDPAARLPLDVPRVYQRADMEQVWFANGGVGYVFGPRIDLGQDSQRPAQ